MRKLPFFILLPFLLAAPFSPAQTLIIPVGQQGTHHSISLPERGQSRASVLRTWGEPVKRHATVGQPPITRWDYRDFSVYFESGVVINSVVHHRPKAAETIIVEEQE